MKTHRLCPFRAKCRKSPLESIKNCVSTEKEFCPILDDKKRLVECIGRLKKSARKFSLLFRANKEFLDTQTIGIISTGCEVVIEQLIPVYNDTHQSSIEMVKS
jgi:hypothetical protein